MRFAKILLLLPLFFTLTCSEAFKSSAPEGLQPDVALPEVGLSEEGYLTLSKNGLGQEYLLQASFIDTSGLKLKAPYFKGTQSRIVYFLQKEKTLFMMESTQGKLSSEEMPVEWILAEFRTIEEDEETIVFDFNEGMKNIFTNRDWHASDSSKNRMPDITVRASHSFLKEVKKESQRIVIQQIAQVELSFFGKSIHQPVEVRYYLENYQPDPNFEPIENPGFERFGFFEAQPFVRPEFGDFQTYIARWNLSKPIVFHISDNTPKEYIDAIKEGVLYWNKVFGTEMVQVKMAPPGIRAPNPDYNLIQWVTYHYAPFAYADAQLDPRTGEILHAQIFLTTAHAIPALNRFDHLKKTEGEKDSIENSFNLIAPDENQITDEEILDNIWIGLKGFNDGLLCVYPAEESPANISYLEKADPDVALKMSQDYIRNTTAHEVGHTLGLRHNFAASSSSKLTPREITELFDRYLHEGTVDVPEQAASSVMDYLDLQGRVLMGHYINQPAAPTPSYDKLAVDWGYYGIKPQGPLVETLYCPDTLEGQYDDCLVGDRGHPTLFQANAFDERVEKLPNLVAQLFLIAKIHFDEKIRKPVGRVALDADSFQWFLTRPLDLLIGQLKDQARSLLLERLLPPPTDVNWDKYDRATTRWIDQAVAKAGGFKKILSLLSEASLYEQLKSAYLRFVQIIEDPKYRSGETVFGEPYQFTDQEIAVMKKMAEPFFAQLSDKVVQRVTTLLAGKPDERTASYRPFADLKGLETTLGNWGEYVVTDQAETWPTFAGETRIAAALVFLPDQGPTPDWQQANRERVLQILLGKLEQRYGQPIESVQPAALSAEERKLYETEMLIIEILSGKGLGAADGPIGL